MVQSKRGEVGASAFALRDYGVTSPPICALARLWTLVARLSTHCGGHYRGQALIVDIQGGRRGSAEVDKIIDGKIIGTADHTTEPQGGG